MSQPPNQGYGPPSQDGQGYGGPGYGGSEGMPPGSPPPGSPPPGSPGVPPGSPGGPPPSEPKKNGGKIAIFVCAGCAVLALVAAVIGGGIWLFTRDDGTTGGPGTETTEPETTEPETTEPETTEPETTEPETTEPETTEPETTEPADLTDEDLDAAAQRFIDFMQTLDDPDFEGACGFVLDPYSGEPMSGAMAQACGEALEEDLGEIVEPGVFDILSPSMVTATDNGDGRVEIQLFDEVFPLKMIQGDDGEWYIDGDTI